MATGEQILRLLQAFREHDNLMFHKVAENIIADEVSANHHTLARDLKRALGNQPKKAAELVVLPRDKRNGVSLLNLQLSTVKSDQIILPESTKRKIDRVLQEHQHSGQLERHGYQPKRKLLFWGPPGCGKTLTAHYVAHELNIPIGIVRLSSLISSFLGDTASHLQSVFDAANKTPMVLLLDEMDAIGKNRNDPNDVGELKRVVNTLLQAMDQYHPAQGLVISASNHQYLLDAALWRRFDGIINFPLPVSEDIAKQLHRLLNGIKTDGRLEQVVNELNGMSFGDIERIVIESIKTMILEERKKLVTSDLVHEIKLFKEASSARQELSLHNGP